MVYGRLAFRPIARTAIIKGLNKLHACNNQAFRQYLEENPMQVLIIMVTIAMTAITLGSSNFQFLK